MATALPRPMAQGALDGPPPQPGEPAGPGAPPTLQSLVGTGGGGVTPEQIAQQISQVGMELDRAIDALMQAAPEGAEAFGVARKAIQMGIARQIQKMGANGAASPTATGPQFPGGGYGSIR